MKIIKHGNKERMFEPKTKTFRFECENCGCVFEDERVLEKTNPMYEVMDYVKPAYARDYLLLSSRCPECGEQVHIDVCIKRYTI